MPFLKKSTHNDFLVNAVNFDMNFSEIFLKFVQANRKLKEIYCMMEEEFCCNFVK
jgi:hypothetical protein